MTSRSRCRSEALDQAGLHALGSNQSGLTGVLVNLGPFGASHAGGVGLYLWAVVYTLIVAALANAGFAVATVDGHQAGADQT